jgi:hypothetical protein
MSDISLTESFIKFFYEVFSIGIRRVRGVFEPGKHIDEWCFRLQFEDKTATISARYHLKTTVVLAYLAWKLYRCDLDGLYNEWYFMGYKEDLASHHLRDLKRYIENIPEYFDDCQNLTTADTILHYRKNGCEFYCEPLGILSFKRGLHPKGLICDDILRDPEVKLDISQLKKIETIFREQILNMPTDELHIVGTPQDSDDLFAWLSHNESFDTRWYKAELDKCNQVPLWPEFWNWDKLQLRKNEIGDKAYNKEFMCSPVRSEEGYFSIEDIDSIINKRLTNYACKKKAKINGYCFGGLDIGKKRHPSHISLFSERKDNRLVQIASIWLDRQDYTEQLSICKWLCESYRLQKFYYDDTRAELEGFRERGELPAGMKGVTFTRKEKFEMAATFEQAVRNKRILLLSDERQRRQILNVDNNLESIETDDGHGDSFWSNALAISAAEKPQVKIRII